MIIHKLRKSNGNLTTFSEHFALVVSFHLLKMKPTQGNTSQVCALHCLFREKKMLSRVVPLLEFQARSSNKYFNERNIYIASLDSFLIAEIYKIEVKNWYFVTKIVLTYCEEKLF